MKKLFVFIIALSVGLFLKEDANVTKENKATFKATTEAATKTALEEDGSVYKVVWQSGDEIVVIDGNSYIGVYSTTSTTSHAEFTYESGSEAKDPDYRAMYPVAFFNSGYPAIPAVTRASWANLSTICRERNRRASLPLPLPWKAISSVSPRRNPGSTTASP